MTNLNETASAETKIENTVARDATKDAGRVRIGAGYIRFSDTATGRGVTKDAGRVHIGAGYLRHQVKKCPLTWRIDSPVDRHQLVAIDVVSTRSRSARAFARIEKAP